MYAVSAISVFFGGVIYIMLRPTESAFFNLFGMIGLENWTDLIRENTVPISQYFPKWFVYTLPNGLWAFAYTLLILTIWRGSKSVLKYFWMATIPILVFGFEVLQYTGTIRGTFAIDDIFSGFVGIVCGVLIGNRTAKIYNYEKNKV